MLFNWESLHLNMVGGKMTRQDVKILFSLCEVFNEEISNIVKEETQTWKELFEHNLSLIDERLKLQSQQLKEGDLQITVTNGNQCAGGWDANINGIVSKFTGRIGIVKNLRPGMHNLNVTGKIKSNAVSDAATVKIDPGAISNISITLK